MATVYNSFSRSACMASRGEAYPGPLFFAFLGPFPGGAVFDGFWSAPSAEGMNNPGAAAAVAARKSRRRMQPPEFKNRNYARAASCATAFLTPARDRWA